MLISHARKVMLKFLQARLQQYVNQELPQVQAGFRKGRGTKDQIANIHWNIEKAREFQKKHLLLLHWQPLTVWITTNSRKFFKKWPSLVTQSVKNPPAMQETWVWSLGWEDPLEKGMATHSSILKNSMDRGAWQAINHRITKSQTWLCDFLLSTPEKSVCRSKKNFSSPRQAPTKLSKQTKTINKLS